MNTASMDTAANKTKRLKRANKENIECLCESAAPLKKIKAACAVGAEMVKCAFHRAIVTMMITRAMFLRRNQAPSARCFKTKSTRSTRLEMVLGNFFKHASKERKR